MKKTLNAVESSAITRANLFHYYWNKYFAIWQNQFEISGSLTDQQKYYILKLFFVGQCSAFKIKPFTKNLEIAPTADIMCFADFAPMIFNTYDFPIQCIPINHRGVTFIPSEPLEVNKYIVIGWASKNQKPLKPFVELLINKIVDVEMVINSNLFTLKMPYTIAVSPEDRDRMKVLVNDLLSDEPVIWGDFNDLQSLKVLINSSPFLVQQLYDFKQERENELLTYLGIKTNPVEKAERLITSEVEANAEQVNTQANTFLDSMSEFFERCNLCFKTDYSIRYKDSENVETNLSDSILTTHQESHL